ncbi:8181_t:CDS:2 [Dentiscutata erythropus]|uniref:8181_t:CDS:1 n=1 Tax=Dentiscutata erythropus TaxID=1348616 RepID=A0A9N9NLT8_9GLOM|nr:8181_t:CDS:2 [Dentiscutata erythropus]
MGYLHSLLQNKLKEELLIKEEFEEEQDNLDDADTNFFNSEIHPAENQAANEWVEHLNRMKKICSETGGAFE